MIPGAEHTSCTIEMLNTSNRVDVAVVDEVQVIWLQSDSDSLPQLEASLPRIRQSQCFNPNSWQCFLWAKDILAAIWFRSHPSEASLPRIRQTQCLNPYFLQCLLWAKENQTRLGIPPDLYFFRESLLTVYQLLWHFSPHWAYPRLVSSNSGSI